MDFDCAVFGKPKHGADVSAGRSRHFFMWSSYPQPGSATPVSETAFCGELAGGSYSHAMREE